MEKVLEKQNTESIKKTMQAQEETFKHQVRELHRVYSVQKMLMEDLKKERQRRRHWANHHHQLNPTLHAPAFAYNNSNNQISSREKYAIDAKPRKGIALLNNIDLERPADDHHHLVEEEEMELTLSIGLTSSSSKSYQREVNRDLDSSAASFKSENYMNNNDQDNCSGPSTPMSSSSTTLDQEKKPQWLFQGLSINRTS